MKRVSTGISTSPARSSGTPRRSTPSPWAGLRASLASSEPQQAPRVAKQALAFLGRQDLPLAAVEQAATEVLFEADDLLADGGLGQVQVFAGAGEVAGVDNADEGTEQDQIEHAHSH